MGHINELCKLLEAQLLHYLDDHYILNQDMVVFMPPTKPPADNTWSKTERRFKKRTGVTVNIFPNHLHFFFRHHLDGPGTLFKEIDDKFIKLMYKQCESVDCLLLHILRLTEDVQRVHYIFPSISKFTMDYALAKLEFFGYLHAWYDWTVNELYCEKDILPSLFSDIALPKRLVLRLRKPPLQLTLRDPCELFS